MANSCVVVTPSLRAKASEYNVAIDEMALAVQSWLDLGNRITPETSEKLNDYLNKYFNVGTEKIYTDKKAYNDAVTVWDRYNSKTFDTIEEINRNYNSMVKCFGKENVSKFKNAEGKYEIKIAEPILTTETTLNNSTKYSSEMLDIKEKALKEGTFMKAPNGNPTNLTEKQWLQVRTKAFKNWFGDWESVNKFNTSALDFSRVNIEETSNPEEHQGNTTLKIYIKGQHEKGHFELVKDREFGQYSVHLKTNKEKLEKGDTKILFEELSKAIPNGAIVSTWGSLSEDGIRALNENIGRGMTKIGDRLATKKIDGSSIQIPIYQKGDNSVSKVVDENGEPLVVYHGRKGENGVFYEDTLAYFDRNKSNRYGNNIVEVFLNIRKPYYEDVGNLSNQEYYELQDKLEQNNSDGFISLNKNIFVTSDPIQIKSATDNIGSFNTENGNIYFEGEAVNLQSSKMQIDTRLQELYNANRKNFNINTSVFTKIIEGSEYSDIRNLINKINEGNKKLLEGVEVKFVSPNNLIKGYSSISMAGFNGKRAYYNSTNNIIYVNVDANYENGDALSVIMHELLHAVTVRRLATNLELKKEFEKLLDEYLEHYPRELTYSKSNKHRVEEFVANIWSNKNTIQRLKNIKYESNKSLWDKIVDFFKSILFKDAEGTMFQKASETMVKLLESPANVNVDGLFYESSESKLDEASQKFEKFKNDANDIVRKGPNFEQEHKYIRKDKKTGKWVEVEVSVTKDINRFNHKELVPEGITEKEPTGPNKIPSTLLGNTNDYVARKVFELSKKGNDTAYIISVLENDSNVKNLTKEQLTDLVSSIQNIISKLDEKFGGKDNWRCSSEEVPLLGERVDQNGKKYYVAGIPDLIIWDNTGKFYILDFKTVKDLSEENSNTQLTKDTRDDGTKYLARNRKWFIQTTDYKLMITSMSEGEITPEENKLVMASTLHYPSSGVSYEDNNGTVMLNGKPIIESTQYKAPQALMLYEFGPKATDGPFHLNEVNSFESAKRITEQTEALTPEEKQDSPDLGSKNETPNRVEISVTKLNPIAQQQDLRSIPASERQFLSNFIYHKTSEIITELVNLNDELDATEVTGEFIMNYLGNLKVENLKTRDDVLNKIGIKKIFEFIQDYYFNVDKFDEFEGNYMNVDMNEDDRPVKEANMRTAYSCFKELCRMAYSKFIFYEGISLDDNISSDALSYEVGDESLKVEQDKAKDGEKDNEAWQIHFRNVSAKASLSGAVKRFLGNIAIKTSNGERIIDDYGYGLDTYVDTDLVISKLQAWLTNCETLQEMIDVLNKQKEGYAWVSSILEVLDSDEDNPIKQQFFQNFRKDFTTYSVIYKEWDKDAKKYNYKINIINTKGAEQAVLDVLKANFEMDLGQNILVSNSDKGIKLNEKVVDKDKKLFRLYASDGADNPFSRSTTPEVEHFKALYEALVDLGIPKYVLTYKDFINAYIKKGEIEGEMAAIKMMKEIADASLGILNEIERMDKGPFSPTDSSSKIQGSYYKIIKDIADYMDNAIESSTYENGKMYYSYCNPSYMGKMIRNLRDASGTYSGKARNKNAEFQNSEFGKYVIENYGKYKFFKRTNDDRYVKIDPSDTTQIWWTEWLELLCNDTNNARTSVLAHKVQLTFDKDDYTDLDELHELTSIILEYRNNGDNDMGWFRVPILANKPSNEFIRFLKKTDPALTKGWGSTPIATYKQQIISSLYGTFQQELMRIRTIFERADNVALSEDSIKNFDIPKKVIDKLEKNSDGTIKRTGNNLAILIGNNGKNPSGIAFQYLTLFNDLFTSDVSKDENKNAMKTYIEQKLEADNNNIVNGRQVNDSAYMAPFADLVKEWIDKRFMEDKKEWRKLGLFDESEDGVNKHLNIPTKEMDRELENFYWNDLYAAINIIQLTVTDLSFNKNVEDFQKRFAQVHAPSLRFDEYAKYKNKGYDSSTRVAETSLGENAKAYQRTMTLKDEEVRSEMIAFVDGIFTDLAETSGFSNGEKAIINAQKESIKDSLKKVNVADAQGFTCPTAYRKKMIMMGEWNDTLETAYIKIKSGDFTPEDIKPLLLQPLKPFVYTKINKKTGVDTLGEMPVPVQNKNSEYMLFVAGAMAQSGRLKDSKIAGIYEFMEESAETDGIYNGIGIDTIQFESAVKSGLEGKIDLSNEALAKYKAEHSPNMSDREAVKAILKEKSTYNEATASIKGNYGSTGKYNMTYVHEVPFEDYGIQQNVPAHFQDHSQAMGSQIRILNPSDLTGSEYIVGKEKMTAQQLRDEYFHIAARNIELSINKLKEDFMLDSNVREERVKTAIRELLKRDTLPTYRFNEKVDEWVSSNIITKGMGEIMKGNFKGYNNHGETKNSNTVESITKGVNFTISNDERTNILYNLIRDEILKDGKYGYDMLQSISLVKNSNGELEFNIPLCDSTQTIRIQQMLNSIVKSRVNKQRIKGGPVVQASVFGQAEDLKIRLADNNGNELLSFSEYTDLDKLTTDSDYNKAVKEYQKYLKDNHALLKHFEIYVTCPSEELENLLVKAATLEGKNAFYYLDNPQEAVTKGYIDESMLRMIGYRIPTEDKYSMQPCKVKRFLPRSAGEAVMLPKEITWMSGSDFDIDKLYIETRTYDFNGDTFDDPKDEFDINNNKLFEMQWGVLTNPDTLPKMFNPGGFDMQKSSVRRLEIMEAVNVGKLKLEDIEIVDSSNNKIHLTIENLWENLEKLSLDDLDDIIASHNINNRNIIFASTQVYFHKQNMTAGKLIGIFANNNTSHSFVNIHNEKHKDNPIEISFGKKAFTLNGINYYGWGPIDNLYSNDGVTPISKVIASYLAASVDAVKDPVLNKMNLNTLTTGPAMLLTRMGVDSNTVGLFFRHPIIMYVTREYFKANSERFTRIEDVIDKVCDDLGLTSNVKNPTLNNAELSKNIGKEITLNHMKDDKGEDTKIIEMRNISQSNEVLSIFKTLCSAASDLNDLTFCTKFNSMTNVAGPKISDNEITVNRVKDFFDRVEEGNGKTIFNKAAENIISGNEMLQAFYSVFEGNDNILDEMFKPYFPQYSESYNMAKTDLVRSLPKGLKLNNEVLDKLADFMSVYRILDNGVFKIDRNKYNYFISQSPSGFISKVAKFKETLKDNKLISMLEITPSSKRCNQVTINARGGGLSSDQQDEIKTAWNSLIESEDAEIRRFGVELAEYFMIRGGFGFNPKTVMHLMPVELKEAIVNYRDIMSGKSIVNGTMDTTKNWNTDYQEMLYQFIRNMASVRKLSYKLIAKPEINKEDIGTSIIEKTTDKGKLLLIQEDSDIYNELGKDNLWFEYSNQIAFSTEETYSEANGTYKVYKLTDKLGIGNNFLEIYPNEGYDTKSLFNSGAGRIDAEFIYSSDESDSGEKINSDVDDLAVEVLLDLEGTTETDSFDEKLDDALYKLIDTHKGITESTIEKVKERVKNYLKDKC